MIAYEDFFGESVTVRRPVDWDRVHGELGVILPEDYRRFAELYPALHVGSLVTILHPDSLNTFANLLEHAPRITQLWTAGSIEGEEMSPYPIFPADDGLLPWGYDDDNGHYFWRTKGIAEEWTIVITESHEWWEYQGGFGKFWQDLMVGGLRSPLLPEEFPGADCIVEKIAD